MCHASAFPTNLHHALFRFDLDLLEHARALGCAWCGGVLHRADYPRKPWSVPGRVRGLYEHRFSLCCDRDGCRRRTTPGSVRFLGRRRHVAAMVILLSALTHGVTARRGRILREVLGVSARTVTRWRTWWRADFLATPFWRHERGRFGALDRPLPAALLDAFDGRSLRERLILLLRFLVPLRAGYPPGAAGPQDRSVSATGRAA